MSQDGIDERYVHLEGCHNFRDLGGYPARDGRRVRRGRVFRSDALHLLTESDVRRVRDELRLRAIIDVRSASEVRIDGAGPLAGPPVAYHHVPLFSDQTLAREPEEVPEDLGHRYFLMMRYAREPIGCVLRLVADARAPAVFHCAAGKDRTGVISAVILAILGVSEADIVDDYVCTSRNLDRIIERLRGSRAYRTIFTQLPPETLHADPGTMESLLHRVREAHGSMREYARTAGVDDDALARLEARLLEPA